MAKLEEKLQHFEDAVMNQAKQQSETILSGMEQVKTKEISSTEDSALSNAYELIQGEVSEISIETAKEISQKRFAQKQEYLLRRAALEKSVFSAVRKRLLDYTQTDAYKEYLKSAAAKLTADYAERDVTLKLKEADKPYEALVRDSFHAPCTVVFSNELTLGGILLVDNQNGYVSDLSLDAVLNDQRDWFYQNCNFNL